jgi:hypothetical protein
VRVIKSTLRVEQVVDVRAWPHRVDLTAVDDPLKVLLVAVQSQSFRITVHSVLVVLFREAVLVVPNGVPRRVAKDLHEPVLELDLPDRLLRLVGATVLELL